VQGICGRVGRGARRVGGGSGRCVLWAGCGQIGLVRGRPHLFREQTTEGRYPAISGGEGWRGAICPLLRAIRAKRTIHRTGHFGDCRPEADLHDRTKAASASPANSSSRARATGRFLDNLGRKRGRMKPVPLSLLAHFSAWRQARAFSQDFHRIKMCQITARYGPERVPACSASATSFAASSGSIKRALTRRLAAARKAVT